MAKANNQIKEAFQEFNNEYISEIVLSVLSNTRYDVGDILVSFIEDKDYDDDGNGLIERNYFKLNEPESYINVYRHEEEDIPEQEVHEILGNEKYEVKTRFQVVAKDYKTGVIAISALLPNGKLTRPYVPMAVGDVTECTLMHFELDKDYEDSILLDADFDIKEVYKRELAVLAEKFEQVAIRNKQSCIILPHEDFDMSKLQLTLLNSLGKVKNNTSGHIQVWATNGIDTSKFWGTAANQSDQVYIEWKVGRTGKISIDLDDIENYNDYCEGDSEFVAIWLSEPQEVKDGAGI